VCLVDLALLRQPRGVPGALAAALGLAGAAADPVSEISSFLRDKSMLVVLDNCEHVIEVAATVVETILQNAPGVHFLATSREPLGAESESVHRLEPLAVPPEPRVTRADVLAFAAVQLFIERAELSCDSFKLEDAEVPLVATICRRLDGNPLAIKLAAERAELLGVKGLAAGLDQGLHLVIEGRRTAVPRHQTLGAMLDWSYELLAPSEQAILRRLAVFAGSFDQLCATAVVTDEAVTPAEVFKCLASLAAKSLLVVDVTAGKILYRLPNMPRAYALEKLRDSGELEKTQRRHAEMSERR
jgi:predicted ATPase